MKTRIVRIGNSQGIRIPKLLLQHSNLAEEVEVKAEHDRIIISSSKQPRQTWAAACRSMAKRGDDSSLDKNLLTPTKWDEADWEW